MQRRLATLIYTALLSLAPLSDQTSLAQGNLPGEQVVAAVSPSVVLILVSKEGGKLEGLGSGVIVDANGIILTANHVIKDARQVQVRQKNGEFYDRVELIGVDDRRDVAALRIVARGLPVLAVAEAGEKSVGEAVYVVSNPEGLFWSASNGILSALRLADEVPGAGAGYRILQFTAPISPGSSGGALVDSKGRLLGIVVGSMPGQNVNFAVPIQSVLGLASAQGGRAFGAGRELTLPKEKENEQENPTPESVKKADTRELARASRTVCITSQTTFFKPDMLAHELDKQPEFHNLGLAVAMNCRVADVDIMVDRPIFTYYWTFVAKDRNTSLVIGSGKVIAFDGIHAAPGLAKQFVAQMKTVQEPAAPKEKKK